MFTSVVSSLIQLTTPQVVITVFPLPLYFLRIILFLFEFEMFFLSFIHLQWEEERSIIIVYDADDTT